MHEKKLFMSKNRFILSVFFVLSLIKVDGQVNLQTGSAVFSLPMFNWQDDKSRLTSVVALSYNSGNGLRVNDVASNVGQGWNLIEGGVISRIQVGEPDDQQAYSGSYGGLDWDITKYPAGILHASFAPTEGCPDALTKYPLYGSMNQVYSQPNDVAEDRQLDYFSFQFNGKSGMFVLNPANIGVAQPLGDTKMKITFLEDFNMFNQGIRTTITSFTIQDVDGLIYKFSTHGLTKILRSGYCDANLVQEQKQPKFKNSGVYNMAGYDNNLVAPWVIDNWYLSEIDDPYLNRKVSFSYDTAYINSRGGEDISYNEGDKDYCVIMHKTSVAKTPEIAAITYPDGHLVTFNYGAARVDLNGENVLSSIDISYNGRYLSKYLLTSSYFILNHYGIPVSDYEKSVARLCLRSVQKVGVDLKEDSPPYIFDYYLGSDATDDFVPPPFFYAKDIWGYYNGNNSIEYDNSNSVPLNTSVAKLTFDQVKGLCCIHNGVSGAYLNPKSGYAQNGLLRQIIYPTGGTLTYQYAQNSGIIIGAASAVTVGGVHVSQTSSTDGGYSNNCDHAITTLYNYVLSDETSSSLWGIEMPVNSIEVNNHYEPEGKKWHWPPIPYGECHYKFQYPGILSQQQKVNVSWAIQLVITIQPYLNILSVIGTIKEIIDVASGSGNVVLLVIDLILDLIDFVVTCFVNNTKDIANTSFYNFDLNGASPLPEQFKRVEIVENPGTIGKTVQEFTSSDDYPLWEPSNPSFSAKQRFAPWAYGLPKITQVYDVNGNKIKEVVNVYNFNTHLSAHCGNIHYDRTAILKVALTDFSCKCNVHKNYSQNSIDYSNAALYDDLNSFHQTNNSPDITVDIYDLYTGRTELDTTYERIFKTNDPAQFVETVTGYVYNDDNYEPSLIKTKLSDGSYKQKDIFYTIDFVNVHGNCYDLTSSTTTNPEIISLVQHNIISLPVETNEMLTNSTGSITTYTYDKATLFTTLANGDIKPSRILEGRFSQPGWQSSPWPSDYSSFSYWLPPALLDPANPDYNFYKIAQTFTYDASGNLTGIKDEGGRSVTNIYDYDDKYVVASVINADPIADKPAYSSFETTDFGGWTKTGTGSTYNTATSINGSQSFNLASSNSLTSSLNTSRPYTLSFWATAATFSISTGATLVKSAPTINGFTYYEYDIAQGTSSISVNGPCTLDELRLYPKSARMRTITYDPLIGKTSECDENNRITYYEYDNLGRLRFIKDEARNIVKMYEYNNVSAAKQNGCPGIYHNHLITEIFTRNDCGAGYLGGSVIYSVPADTYSSYISQADADAQAEGYLLANGQNYADTSGSCTLLYYNTQQSQVFTTQSCDEGHTGGNVTYTVPAGRYSSTISQADANQQALDEILANGQAYANDPANAVCNLDTNPHWESDDGSPTQCQLVNGEMHLFLWATDVNPNSSTYNQSSWQDTGPSDLCPSESNVDIYGENDTNYDQYILLTNTATNDQYYFDLGPLAGPELLASVPSGVYDIQITQQNQYYYSYSAGCSNYADGFEAYFYNVTIDNSCNPFTISVSR